MDVNLIKDDAASKDGRTAYNIYSANGIKLGRWVESDRGFISVRWYINGAEGTELNAGRLFADEHAARKYAEADAVTALRIKKGRK